MREEFFIHKDYSVKDAMKQMGKVGEKILFIVGSNNVLQGSLTDGDIRRWILAEGNILEVFDKI